MLHDAFQISDKKFDDYLCSTSSFFFAWSRASVFNDELWLSDYCLVLVVGDVMGFCSWVVIEGVEDVYE